MLSQEAVLSTVSEGRASQCLDGRDYARLIAFFPLSDWHLFGFTMKEGEEPLPPLPWTKEEVLSCLERDLSFAFEKALGKRGISASLMYEVIKTWLWVLEDDLQHFEEYAQYGLPLFKAVALKYGFENRIGNNQGNEWKYSAEADEE